MSHGPGFWTVAGCKRGTDHIAAGTVCSVRALAHPSRAVPIHAEANTNISHSESVIPAVRYEMKRGRTVLVMLVGC